MFVYFDEIASNNIMLLNRNKINMNRYDIKSYLFIYTYFIIICFSLVSLVSHTPSGPPYTPAS